VRSADIPAAERIGILEKRFKLRTPVLAAWYILYDANTSARSVPGATDRDFRVCLKVKTSDVSRWYDRNRITSFPHDFSWAGDLGLPDDVLGNVRAGGGIMTYDSDSGFTDARLIFPASGIILLRLQQR
jgi:hypothetical protein